MGVLRAQKREHPEVRFSYDEWNRVHRAVIPEDGGSREIVEQELRALLDRLEALNEVFSARANPAFAA